MDAGSAEGSTALQKLCQTYWYPLYAHARRRGHNAHDAQDLTQAFFERFLEKDYLNQVHQERGRFRSFLLATLDHFLSDQLDRSRALKRGGGQPLLSLDAEDAEGRFLLEPAVSCSVEQAFDRCWALALLDQALERLQKEMANAGKERQFHYLKPFLCEETAPGGYDSVASTLGMSVGAVRMGVLRLRERFGSLVRDEVAHTLASQAETGEEMRYLIELVSG